jgi:hypothetical protein
MRYLRSYQFIFDNPKWLTNVLMGVLAQVIPLVNVVAIIIFDGYLYEVVEAMHRRGDATYPDVDFNRLGKYLMRGLWPFLVRLIIWLPIGVLLGIFYAVAMGVTAAVFGDSRSARWVVPVVLFVVVAIIMVVVVVVLVLSMPLQLRAGLSQELDVRTSLDFMRDFLRLTAKEVILAELFLVATGFLLYLVGILLCCFGVYPAAILVRFAQHHLYYQLYELYLQRGGMMIPLKVEEPPAPL